MSSYLRRHVYGAIAFWLIVTVGFAVANLRQPQQEPVAAQEPSNVERDEQLPAQSESASRFGREERPADYFADHDRSGYFGYTIERRLRKVLLEEPVSQPLWIDVEYVNLKRGGKLLKTFDADVYFGLGNSANFGFFPFLGTSSKQLFVSQDVFRGGRQWIVSLVPRFRVIFDGKELGVGREASDLTAIDLDHDGVLEVIAPITNFYAFQDKMSISDIPLPSIVFRYNQAEETYLPANSVYRDYVMEGLAEVPSVDSNLQNEFHHRGAVLNNLLIHIYAGDETHAWNYFDQRYELDDKEEMRRRVKEILRRQRVYNLIYKSGKKK